MTPADLRVDRPDLRTTTKRSSTAAIVRTCVPERSDGARLRERGLPRHMRLKSSVLSSAVRR